MTSAALMVSRGKLFSRALRKSHCSEAAALVFQRHHSSLQQSIVQDDDEEEAVEWTSTAPAFKASLPLITTTTTTPSSLQQQQHNEDDNATEHVSPSELVYTGNHKIPITSKLHIVTPEEDTPRGTWPVFRLMVSFG